MTRTELVDRIQHLLSAKGSCIVAIDGMSASGKTTLGNDLHNHFSDSTLFHMDDYFLQPHQRTTERLLTPGGGVDYERFHQDVISRLHHPDGCNYQRFNCQTQTLEKLQKVTPKSLVIIEGAYSQHPYFGDIYDIRIFCEINQVEQKARILKRDGKAKWLRFESEWIPREHAYFTHYQIKERSELLT